MEKRKFTPIEQRHFLIFKIVSSTLFISYDALTLLGLKEEKTEEKDHFEFYVSIGSNAINFTWYLIVTVLFFWTAYRKYHA